VLQLALAGLGWGLFVAGFASYTVGGVAPNPQALAPPAGSHTCRSPTGDAVPCCEWRVAGWVPAALATQAAALLWTVFLIFEVKVFVIAGAVAQWYFAPVEGSGAGGGASRPGSRTLTSVRHALGPSFGSLCLGSLILAVVSQLRSALQRAREQRDRAGEGSLLLDILSACADGLLSLMEGVTKFTTVQLAITGQPFFAAGRSVVALLSRNLLDTAGVWWFPPLVLQTCSAIVAAAWGALVFYASRTMWGGASGAGAADATASALTLAVLSGATAWVMLAFLSSLVLNVVDAVFVCFAMDRDRHRVTMPEVHELYLQLPSAKGAAVQNPDDSYAYAAEEGAAAPPAPRTARR